eukprot:1531928-Pyramimonas_sp.AAC.1
MPPCLASSKRRPVAPAAFAYALLSTCAHAQYMHCVPYACFSYSSASPTAVHDSSCTSHASHNTLDA